MLSPKDLAEAAETRGLKNFLTLYGEAPLLLVRVDNADADLLGGLEGSAARAAGADPVSGLADRFEFHTIFQTLPMGATQPQRGRVEDPAALAGVLHDAPHFAVSLGKRKGADALFMDRISVGRARNKDIVLRHPSVSKFHAWFQADTSGGFRVTDPGSKNRTHVNGTTLVARQSRAVEPGDSIRFGAIECLLCSPQALWTVARLPP
jgi:hypothetical protein